MGLGLVQTMFAVLMAFSMDFTVGDKVRHNKSFKGAMWLIVIFEGNVRFEHSLKGY